MITDFPADERQILEAVRDFVVKKVSPASKGLDAEEIWPEQTLEEMKRMGMFGIAIPEENGGFFKSYGLYYETIREIAKICASHALILLSHSFCAHLIKSWGTRDQKDRWLPKMASGEFLGAVAMTETDAGSDLSAIRTKTVPCEGGYLLNGHKQFITNGSRADVIVVLTATSATHPIFNKTLFIVEPPLPGFGAGKRETKMGFRGADTSELFFDDVKLGGHAMLGREGQGLLSIMTGLQYSRLATAALALGIAESAHEESIRYAKQRKQFGKPICEFQIIQQYLADNETELECSRLLLRRAACRQDQGESIVSYASMVKYYGSETALRVVSRALQIHGAYGYIKDFPIERHYRDVRLCTIFEGSSEILRMVIARQLCGLRQERHV